ncbi:MAG: MarR family winged helix-turn-helix transcriptional regulator [Candidatus Bipolaricaulia bacterium]
MGTHHHGSDEVERALDAYIKLVRASETFTAWTGAVMEASELSGSQFGVLEALLHRGPMHQHEIAKRLLKSGGNVTMVIDNLEKRDMVRRERDPNDRRCVTVRLTEAGREAIERVFPRVKETIVEGMAALTPEEQETLAKLCRKLGRDVAAHREAT